VGSRKREVSGPAARGRKLLVEVARFDSTTYV